jgi:hypothetical protein
MSSETSRPVQVVLVFCCVRDPGAMFAPTMLPLPNVNMVCNAISVQVAQGRVAGAAQAATFWSPADNSCYLKNPIQLPVSQYHTMTLGGCTY